MKFNWLIRTEKLIENKYPKLIEALSSLGISTDDKSFVQVLKLLSDEYKFFIRFQDNYNVKMNLDFSKDNIKTYIEETDKLFNDIFELMANKFDVDYIRIFLNEM